MFTTNEISFKVSTNVEFIEEIERLEIIIELLQTIVAKAKLKDLRSIENPKLLKINDAKNQNDPEIENLDLEFEKVDKAFDAILEEAEKPIEKEDQLMKNTNTITCECGTIMTKKNLTRHLKSAKHQNFVKLS